MILSIFGIIGILMYKSGVEIITTSFNDLRLSKDEIEKLKCNRIKTTKLQTDIYFDGNKLFYDYLDNKYYYSLIENSNTANNPQVYIKEKKSKIGFEYNEINEDLIKNNICINVFIYDDNSYFESYIVCTSLPLMNIYVKDSAINFAEGSDLYNIIESDMKLLIFDNNKNKTFNYNGKFRIRGDGTSYYPKKGYKIILENKEVEDNKQQDVSILDLPEGKEYVLYAGYNDSERIRNVFCSQLWYEGCSRDNSFNVNIGFYYKYVELFINGEYWGLYAISYKINEEQMQLNSNNVYENIYKKTSFWSNEYDMNYQKDFSSGYDLLTNEGNKEAWQPLINYYDALLDENNIEEIYRMIDIDNSIDIFIFYYLIQGTDHVQRKGDENLLLYNTYLISKNQNGNLVMLYYPWDFDRTFGFGFNEDIQYEYSYDRNFIMKINPIYLLLQRGDSEIKNLVIDKYNKLRTGAWSDKNVKETINKFEKEIFDSGSYSRDAQRWGNSFIEDENIKLSVFEEYVINRLHYCDKNIYEILDIKN